MVRISNPTAPDAKGAAYQVERPRVSDAVGAALQRAYAGDFDLPDDMVQVLRRLSRHLSARVH